MLNDSTLSEGVRSFDSMSVRHFLQDNRLTEIFFIMVVLTTNFVDYFYTFIHPFYSIYKKCLFIMYINSFFSCNRLLHVTILACFVCLKLED